MSESGQDKTEAPTAKRLKKARDEGNILRSKDFAAAIVVLFGCGWIAMFGGSMVRAVQGIMAASLTFGRADVDDFEPMRPLIEAGTRLFVPMGTLLALVFLAAILSQVGLGAFSFNAKLLAPKPSRINPASGIKRIFGPQGWIEMGKSLLKVILLGSIGYVLLSQAAHHSMGLLSSDLEGAVGVLSSDFTILLFAMAAGLAAIAAIDVPIAAYRLKNKLMMTKQEVRDEHKESEGSPESKQAIRGKQREVMKRSFRKAVAEAHVVLTNPTHFAVALRYQTGRDQVPVVVAKGRGETALAIRELAKELEITTLESPALARAVYYTSREGQEIRDDLYRSIATVLAFVFNVNAQAGGTLPHIDVPATARFDENGRQMS